MCAECQGLGTLGIRARILQKPIFFGFLERKKCKQTIRLMPSHEAFSLITILAEQTAEGYTHDPKFMKNSNGRLISNRIRLPKRTRITLLAPNGGERKLCFVL